MSFKIYLLLLLVLVGCGVKKPPQAIGDSATPSFFDEFIFDEEKVEDKKKK